jgi:hypothetical protein
MVTASTAPGPSTTQTSVAPRHEPGRPYSAEQILAVMRAINADTKPSRDPPLPAAIVNQQVAFKIAQAVWSWDGEPYRELAIQARCGRGCDLSVGGVPAYESVGTDDYLFKIGSPPAPDDFSLGDRPALEGYPAELEADLETMARSLAGPDLEGLSLMVSSWFPPPRDREFMLRFDDGNEEGGRIVWVWLTHPDGVLLRHIEERS